MNLFVCGSLGGGKSLWCVLQALEYLARGFPVFSNIELQEEAVDRYFAMRGLRGLPWRTIYKHFEVGDYKSEWYNPWKWPEGDKRGSGGRRRVLVIIDEAAEWFDSYGARGDGFADSVFSWSRQSDKRGQDVLFVVQHVSMLHKRLRVICHGSYYCTDLSKMKVPHMGIGVPWPWSQYIVVKRFDKIGNDLNMDRYVSRDPRLFACYITGAEFGKAGRDTGVLFDCSAMDAFKRQKMGFLAGYRAPVAIAAVEGLAWGALTLFG